MLKEKEIPHSIIHTNDYYKEIYQRLKSATTREEFLEQLRLVKEDIIHNRFWDRNPQKLKEIEDYRQEKINEYQILKEYEEELKDIPYHLLDPDTKEKAHSIARTSDHTTEDYRTVIDRIREEIKNEGSIWSETIKGTAHRQKRSVLKRRNSSLNRESNRRPPNYEKLRRPPNRSTNHLTHRKASKRHETKDRSD